ncbi:hypothetical protein ZWY2020_007914 [Hordeum vulgare]|nr:hypothetical protein ZWY2020_007914 [Hordeum vulgare]
MHANHGADGVPRMHGRMGVAIRPSSLLRPPGRCRRSHYAAPACPAITPAPAPSGSRVRPRGIRTYEYDAVGGASLVGAADDVRLEGNGRDAAVGGRGGGNRSSYGLGACLKPSSAWMERRLRFARSLDRRWQEQRQST